MKAQAWTLDFIFAMLIFSIAIILLLTHTVGRTDYNIVYDFDKISSHLITDGYPTNWNNTNVVYPGLLSNGILNETKINQIKLLNNSFIISSFGIRNNFYVNITDRNGKTINISGPACFGIKPSNPSEIIEGKRLSSFNGVPVIINIMVWK